MRPKNISFTRIPKFSSNVMYRASEDDAIHPDDYDEDYRPIPNFISSATKKVSYRMDMDDDDDLPPDIFQDEENERIEDFDSEEFNLSSQFAHYRKINPAMIMQLGTKRLHLK